MAIGSPHENRQGHVLVRFVVKCSETVVGEHIRVVGSLPKLGSWDVGKSVAELCTTTLDFPEWSSDWLLLPAGGFEYKYAHCKESGAEVLWEDAICNRELCPKANVGRITVVERFNGHRLEVIEEPLSKSTSARSTMLPASSSVSSEPPEDDELGELPDISPREPLSSPMCSPVPPRSSSFAGFLQGPMHSFDDDDSFARGLVRWNSFGCSAELPVGFVPTRRRRGTLGGEGLYREATYGGTLDGPPQTQKAAGKLDPNYSGVSTCIGRDTPGLADDDNRTTFGDDAVDVCENGGPDRKSSFEDLYCVEHRLGSGAFGMVYSCMSRNGGHEYAVKVVQKDRLGDFALRHLIGDEETGKEGEISLHMSLPRHNNIICLHECFEESWGFRLVLDFCRGGDLFEELVRAKQLRASERVHGALLPNAARNAVRQLLSALAFCHDNGLVHRDVKTENMLLEFPASEVPLEGSGNIVKLCDFGLSARCYGAGAVLDEPVGSPDYLAPEVARLEHYGNKVDVWSAGAVLFVSLRGCMPYLAKTDVEALRRVREGAYHFDGTWDFLDPDARACVESLMVLDVDARPSARGALALPWLC